MTSTLSFETDPNATLTEFGLRHFIQRHPTLVKVVRYVREETPSDSAHDFSHFSRVLSNALMIMQKEGGDLEIVIAAALLHDIKNLPKDHPQAKSSSSLSAQHAGIILEGYGFPKEKIAKVKDAILCHSFTRGLQPRWLEGKILQDADRLDGLGAIGVARAFAVGGSLSRSVYHPQDPFARLERELDDKSFTVDHFYRKLFQLPDLMQTATGRQMAIDRIEVMHQYLDVLEREINPALDHFLRQC
jgi:uncharacterized protein